jgi:hypothetical protein
MDLSRGLGDVYKRQVYDNNDKFGWELVKRYLPDEYILTEEELACNI